MNQQRIKTNQQDDEHRHLALVGRQSIYDKNLEVYGYELLYRSMPSQNFAPAQMDGNVATSEVVLNTFLEIGLEKIVANKNAFINLTASFINGAINLPLSQKNVVLEILETVEPDQEILRGLKELKERGYIIALDDFSFDPSAIPLLQFADIIKVDLMITDKSLLESQVELLKKNYKAQLLAEKIETNEDFMLCKKLGFDLFQGYFLEKPVLISGKKLPANKLGMLQILGRLQDPKVDINELQTLIKNDVSLSFKVLRYINSPAFGLSSEITSLKQAIVLLGLNTLKRWISLIVIAGVCEKSFDLIRLSLVRAKMCEEISKELKLNSDEESFLTGLFSLLDAILDQSLETILKSIPLSRSMNDALLFGRGKIGVVLQKVKLYEKGSWDKLLDDPKEANLYSRKYLDAISWADNTLAGLIT